MEEFKLAGHPFIELNNLMKVMGWCESGGRAGVLITEGVVSVDGAVELRKRCKLRIGQVIEFDGNVVKIAE